MVRNRIPSTKSHTDDTVFATAIKEVVDGTLSLRAAADTFAIPKSTLARDVTKYRNAAKTVGNGEAATNISYQPNWNNRQVFTGEQESLLKEYLIEAAKHHAGLTKKMVRELSYEYAKTIGRKYPLTWDTNSTAGICFQSAHTHCLNTRYYSI